jgi:hypothetical protein
MPRNKQGSEETTTHRSHVFVRGDPEVGPMLRIGGVTSEVVVASII